MDIITESFGALEMLEGGTFLEDEMMRKVFLSGLGDFHLRSAVKGCNIERFLNGKGRYREQSDWRTFSVLEDISKVTDGDISILLAYFLIFRNKLVNDGLKDYIISRKGSELEHAAEVVRRRLKMELNRDIKKKLIETDKTHECLKGRLIQEYDSDTYTEYYDCRCITELLVQISSSIATKRTFPDISKELGYYVGEDKLKITDFKNHLHSRPKLFCTVLGGLDIYLGGDLMFVRFQHEGILEYPLKTPSHMMEDHYTELSSDKIIKEFDFIEGFGKGWNVYRCDILKMINDKLSERDIVLRNAKIGHSLFPSVYPSVKSLEMFFESGDFAILKMGNLAYKGIKCFEAIMTGVILSRCSSKLIDVDEFLMTTVEDLYKESDKLGKLATQWIRLTNSLTSDHQLTQIYGLYRLWGHPVVSPKEGIKKVKKIGTEKKTISEELARKAGYSFLEEVFDRYKSRWGRYPAYKVILREGEDEEGQIDSSYLLSCLRDNIRVNTKKDTYIAQDWDSVIIVKTLDIPETFNLVMVVDDKAISPPKSYLIQVAQGSKKLMNPYERRGVLKWMNEDYAECKNFLKEINDNGLPDDDCVIGLYPKERELNSVPRMFSLMSAKMRNYIVVTEHMIAEDILPFFPQITMTDDLLGLTKKIYSTTRRQFKNEYSTGSRYYTEVSVCMNMDFEKWNLNMRKESTLHVFDRMGELYGLPNLFNRTYDIFKESFIYLCDDEATLKCSYDVDERKFFLLEDGEYSYKGHIGGFEGLRQKGWTVFTVSVIKMVLAEYPVSYKLMGQGDNQVLLLTMKTGKIDEKGNLKVEGYWELSKLLDSVINSLKYTFLGLGLPLKTLESWRSENFFLYGKLPVKNGVPLSLSLKKLSRSFPFSNEDSMTIDNVMSAIFTNAQAASMGDISHHISYCSGIFEVFRGCLMLLNWHPFSGMSVNDEILKRPTWFTYEEEQMRGKLVQRVITRPVLPNMSIDQLAELLTLFPKSLGGSNGITEYEFLMRGFPDNQSRDFTYLTELVGSNFDQMDEDIKFIVDKVQNILKLQFSKSKNLDFLVEDPCAINLVQPPTPLTVLRKEVKKALSENAQFRNKNFMELFKLSTDKRKRELLQALASEQELFPRLLHDCYAASLFGFVDGIVSKVDKTVTVQRMCLETAKIDIIGKICGIEMNYIKYLVWRVNHYREGNEENEPSLRCPTNYIRWARNFGWGKEVKGVTVPYPSHILKSRGKMDALECKLDNYLSCHISDKTPRDLNSLTAKLGNSPPYLGSYTKTKMKNYDRVALYSSEPLINRIVRLIKSLSWGRLENSNLHNYLIMLLRSVCDIDDELFLMSPDDIGGSMEHRYKDSSLKHGALSSSLYGLSTWMHMSTDNFGKYSKGSKNVTLHFQAMLCWMQTCMYEILINRCSNKSDIMKEYHFHLSCEECIVSVEYDIPDISEVSPSLIPSLRDNPYCFVRQISLTEKDRSIYASGELFNYNKNLKAEELSRGDNAVLYHEHWAGMIFNDLLSAEMDDDTAVGTGILELSRYPRISFLRANHNQLMDNLFLLLAVHVFRVEVEKDIYGESALNFKKIREIMKNMIQQTHKSRFVGLSILFSWSNKANEIMREYDLDIPDAVALSIEQCLECAKNLMVSYLDRRETLDKIEVSCYLNLGSCVSISSMVETRYLLVKRWERDGFCSDCKREIILGMKGDSLFKLTGEESCSKGHFWFDKELITKNTKVVCISEDSLSKKHGESTLYVPKFSLHSDSEERLISNGLRTMKSFSGLKIISTELDVEYSDIVSDKYQLRAEYKKGLNISRILNRCAMSEISSGYRLLDLLAFIRVKAIKEGESILCLGDGTGSSGRILNLITRVKVLTSSLVDCTKAFPQTFKNSIPTAQLGLDESQFDNSLSKTVINDIFNDEFLALLNYKIKKDRVAICYSDIELEHAEHKDWNDVLEERFRYSKMLARLSMLDVETIVAKVRVKDNHDLYHLVETLNVRFASYSILVTPYCNNLKGDLFLKCSNPRRHVVEDPDRVLSRKTTKKLDDMMTSYSSGKMFKKMPSKYYEASNEIMLSRGILDRSIAHLRRWFSDHKFSFPVNMASCTSFFLSIAAARNPRSFVHHLDKKDKYEYDSTLQNIGVRMIALGLAMIQKEEVVAAYLENLDRFWLIRPAEVLGEGDKEVVSKYTYEVVFDGEIENVGGRYRRKNNKKDLIRQRSLRRDDLSVFPPFKIRTDSEIVRVLPLLRLLAKRDDCMQNVISVKSVVFDYVSEINKERRRSRGQEQVVLYISKSSAYTQINK
ncbi:TPA_asm: L [Zanthoxylum betacytorhabdovirus 1]|nr:TPA_asm: L [Zanthoxilum betacytorhabdovirus 1]